MTDRPTITERYSRATNSSNLAVKADARTDTDMLIASGWTPALMGSILRRLQAEWDGAQKSPRMSETDFLLLLMNLRTLGNAIHAAELWCVKKGISNPGETARKAINLYLDSNCQKCHGRGKLLMQGAARPTLGSDCPACRGTGRVRPGHDVGRVLDMCSRCVASDTSSMRTALAQY